MSQKLPNLGKSRSRISTSTCRRPLIHNCLSDSKSCREELEPALRSHRHNTGSFFHQISTRLPANFSSTASTMRMPSHSGRRPSVFQPVWEQRAWHVNTGNAYLMGQLSQPASQPAGPLPSPTVASKARDKQTNKQTNSRCWPEKSKK